METRKIAAVIILTCLIVGVVFVFYVNRPKSESERINEATDKLKDLMEEYNRRVQEIEDEKAAALKEIDDKLAEELAAIEQANQDRIDEAIDSFMKQLQK